MSSVVDSIREHTYVNNILTGNDFLTRSKSGYYCMNHMYDNVFVDIFAKHKRDFEHDAEHFTVVNDNLLDSTGSVKFILKHGSFLIHHSVSFSGQTHVVTDSFYHYVLRCAWSEIANGVLEREFLSSLLSASARNDVEQDKFDTMKQCVEFRLRCSARSGYFRQSSMVFNDKLRESFDDDFSFRDDSVFANMLDNEFETERMRAMRLSVLWGRHEWCSRDALIREAVVNHSDLVDDLIDCLNGWLYDGDSEYVTQLV